MRYEVKEQHETVKFISENLDSVIRRDKDINFISLEEEITRLTWFFEHYFQKLEYRSRFTSNEQQDIENNCYNPFIHAATSIIRLSQFSETNEDTFSQVRQWKQSIENAYLRIIQQNYLTRLESAVAVNDDSASRFDKENQKVLERQKQTVKILEDQIEASNTELAKERARAEELLAKIEKLYDQSQKSLAKQIKTSKGKEFLADSQQYGKIAKAWLIAQIVIGIVVSFLLGWLLIKLTLTPFEVIGNLPTATTKFALIALGFYAIQVTGRNYSANKHLETINKQRATVLTIVNQLVNSVDEPEYKDYLLTYAAKTVFDHGESGFISKNYGAGSNEESGFDNLLNIINKNR